MRFFDFSNLETLKNIHVCKGGSSGAFASPVLGTQHPRMLSPKFSHHYSQRLRKQIKFEIFTDFVKTCAARENHAVLTEKIKSSKKLKLWKTMLF